MLNINSMAKFAHPLEKINIHYYYLIVIYYYIMLLFYLLIKYLVVLETTIYLSSIIPFCNGKF